MSGSGTVRVMKPGVYPAMVTPMDRNGDPDATAMARLAAWFEAQGCKGVVVAGTNGEGPSLAAVEKRDLLRSLVPAAGRLSVVLGIATPSLSEATWSSEQAAKAGCRALLVMPPSYYPEAGGIEEWFLALANRSPLPILIYNFPQRTGVTISAKTLGQLCQHPNVIGAKDSSGDASNLTAYRLAVPTGSSLFVGDETLLPEALDAGWSGTISGAANLLAAWLVKAVGDYLAGNREAALVRLAAAREALLAIRSSPQPATNKAALSELGKIPCPAVRLPLTSASASRLLQELNRLGVL